MIKSSKMKCVFICLLLFEIFIGGTASALQGQVLDTNDSSADTLTFRRTGEQNDRPEYSGRSELKADDQQYAATIEISFSNQNLVPDLRAFLANISTYDPLKLASAINVSGAVITSDCTVIGTVKECTCDAGYKCTGNLTGSTCSCNSTQRAECCTTCTGNELVPTYKCNDGCTCTGNETDFICSCYPAEGFNCSTASGLQSKNCTKIKAECEHGSSTTCTTSQQQSGAKGIITYTCYNAEWIKKESCVSTQIFDFWWLSQYLSEDSNISLPVFFQTLSNFSLIEKKNISSSEEDLRLMIDIIAKVSDPKLNVTMSSTMTEHFVDVVNVVVDNATAWANIRDLGPAVLQAVENFSKSLQNDLIQTNESNSNVRLKQAIVQPNENYAAFFSLKNLTGNVTIKNESLTSGNKTIVSVAYSTMKDILKPKNDTFINGLVISTVIEEGKKDTDFSISLSYKMHNAELIDPQCVYWDFAIKPAGGWNSDTCKPTTENDVVTCTCGHLTSFSILMSGKSNRFLDIITYIGVAISIASLVIALIIECLIWKAVTINQTSYMRHVCLVNIAVSLLVADIWLMIGAGLEKKPESPACSAAAFFSFYFYLALFFWMLTTGLLLFHRLVFTLQELSKLTLMITAFCLGYGCPLIIAVTTVAVTAPNKQFTSGKFCWLNYHESKAFLAFVVPALTIVFINFIIMLVVISKLLRPSIGERPGKEERLVLAQIAKSVTVLTPLLGITWGFGLAVVFKPENIVYHGIFAALNSLQGLFILISTVLLDKKVRNILKNKITSSMWSTSRSKGQTSSNVSSPTPNQRKKKRFSKKGGYNIFKANSSSNDAATSSLTTS